MGGKANLLDTRKLAALYEESMQFRDQSELSMRAIDRELNKLHDPVYHSGLIDSDAQKVKDTVVNVSEAIRDLKLALAKTNAFIESRLSGIAYIARAEEGHTRTSTLDSNQMHWKLRK